jgi:CRISPR-associated endonuclease/helicase Cas3
MSASGRPTFAEFFAAVHDGLEPFPWQIRLAERVVNEGRWPTLLDLPTGTGKTSAIDVALFALACRPDVFPRRIILVVDRRVVVDQGADHARTIQAAMTDANDGPALHVAQSLRALFGGRRDDQPFAVSVLRGGMPRDESWADRPDRPVVALSTVDQVGSRLLFRGYGVSQRMAPIHAGLLGNDTLFLLDEVQLSTAFSETLQALERRWRPWHSRLGGAKLPDRWAAVRMSATPIGDADVVPPFQLDDDDWAHPLLSRRLNAHKRASLVSVKVAGDERERVHQFAETCQKEALQHLAAGARVVAVVVNRVDTARRVRGLLDNDERYDLELLTGRMRPLERTEMMGRSDDPSSLAGRITAGRSRSDSSRPIIVVATQSIEAGADFDFDALVTECASLDALRQRFGRVDRRGELGESQGTIVARHDQVDGKSDDDPIYGGALAATWAWLSSMAAATGTVDFGVAGFPSLPADPSERQTLFSAAVHAPILLPAHIDAWAQTNPAPEPDPQVALWLHGPGRDVAEVRLIWRADLDPKAFDDRDTGEWEELLPQFTVAPPSSLESISVPLAAARRWLLQQGSTSFGDVEGSENDDAEDRRSRTPGGGRRCLRISRNKQNTGNTAELIEPAEIRPGNTIVVPSAYGGIGHGTWDPDSTAFVPDLGDWAQLAHRGRAVLRLVESVLRLDPPVAVPRKDEEGEWDLAEVDTCLDAIRQALHEGRTGDEAKRRLLDFLAPEGSRRRRYRVVELAGDRLALVGKHRVDPKQLRENPSSEVLTEDDDSGSFIGVPLGLRTHLSDVRSQTEVFARNVGLSEKLVSDLALAAWFHDVGKADRRFQQILVGGSELRLAMQLEPLAKSAGEPLDSAARRRARERSGYPESYRHELLSVAMLEQTAGALASAHDPELVLHLVGSHHGWCRPFAPAVDAGPSIPVEFELDGMALRADTAHELAKLDSGIADRFFDLVDRYGWWGLAWLEAIMRLADHRASEAARDRRETQSDAALAAAVTEGEEA